MRLASTSGASRTRRSWGAWLFVLAGPAAGIRTQGRGDQAAAGQGCHEQLPFDCYIDKGAAYEGLMHTSVSGRTCKNWLEQDVHPPTTKGIGNHNYCRNPAGSKDKPWCHTVDPAVVWEYCEVPACPAGGQAPEVWEAPKGAKSPEAEAKGPCKYTPPAAPLYKEHEAGRACMDRRGSTWWLISNENSTAADAAACGSKCLELPGSAYFTFWKAAAEGNCGCYRQCILVPLNLTVQNPTVFKMA